MEVKQIGTIEEYQDGRLDIQYWVLDDCSYPPTKAEEQELIALAKKNGTYTYRPEISLP